LCFVKKIKSVQKCHADVQWQDQDKDHELEYGQNVQMDHTYIPATYTVDIKNLLGAFQQRNTLSYKVFKNIWKEMNFSLIHQGKREELDAHEFLQTLYVTVLGYFFLNQPLNIRVALLYTLYLLYETQPHTTRVKIAINIPVWQELLKLYEEIKEHKIIPAYQIFRKMKLGNNFSYSAILKHASVPNTIKNGPRGYEVSPELLNADTLTGVVDLDAIEHASILYASSKSQHADCGDLASMMNRDIMNIPPLLMGVSNIAPSLNVVNIHLVNDLKQLLMMHEKAKYQQHPDASQVQVQVQVPVQDPSVEWSSPLPTTLPVPWG